MGLIPLLYPGQTVTKFKAAFQWRHTVNLLKSQPLPRKPFAVCSQPAEMKGCESPEEERRKCSTTHNKQRLRHGLLVSTSSHCQ